MSDSVDTASEEKNTKESETPSDTARPKVNMSARQTAMNFLRHLNGDATMRGEAADLTSFLGSLAISKDGEKTVADWSSLGHKLVQGFEALILDKYEKNEKGELEKVEERSLPEHAKKVLLGYFNGLGPDVSAAEASKGLKDLVIETDDPDKPGSKKKESLLSYLRSISGLEEGFMMTREMLEMVKGFLNRFTPGLGDLVFDMMEGMGVINNNKDPDLEAGVADSKEKPAAEGGETGAAVPKVSEHAAIPTGTGTPSIFHGEEKSFMVVDETRPMTEAFAVYASGANAVPVHEVAREHEFGAELSANADEYSAPKMA